MAVCLSWRTLSPRAGSESSTRNATSHDLRDFNTIPVGAACLTPTRFGKSSRVNTTRGWQLAYHTLFFTHLYLLDSPDEDAGWRGHQSQVQQEDSIAGPPDPESELPVIPRPYTKAEVMEYWTICDGMVDARLDAMNLESEQSGFHWYRCRSSNINWSTFGTFSITQLNSQIGCATLLA